MNVSKTWVKIAWDGGGLWSRIVQEGKKPRVGVWGKKKREQKRIENKEERKIGKERERGKRKEKR